MKNKHERKQRQGRPARLFWVGLVLCAAVPASAQSRCNTSAATLSTEVLEFDAEQVSPVEALIKLGEQVKLCFGIGYVDRHLLTATVDFHLRSVTVEEVIKAMLGPSPELRIESKEGVIEIGQILTGTQTKNVFDYVMPQWDLPRPVPLQQASFYLKGALMMRLDPHLQGFAGHTGGLNPRDIVGPLTENNRSIRYLLDEIVGESSGSTWLATASWTELKNLSLPLDRPVWTIVEYAGPNASYSPQLSAIADKLPASENKR